VRPSDVGRVLVLNAPAVWSSNYYGRAISAILDAAGAPRDLVQIITGRGLHSCTLELNLSHSRTRA